MTINLEKSSLHLPLHLSEQRSADQSAVSQTLRTPEQAVQTDLQSALPMLDFISTMGYKLEFRRPLESGGLSEPFSIGFYSLNRTDRSSLIAYLGYWKIESSGEADAVLEANPVDGTSFSLTRAKKLPNGDRVVEQAPIEEFTDRAATLRYIAENIDWRVEFPKDKAQLDEANKLAKKPYTRSLRRIGHIVIPKLVSPKPRTRK